MSLAPSARMEVYHNRYKVAVDAKDGHCRREGNMEEIRKKSAPERERRAQVGILWISYRDIEEKEPPEKCCHQ